MHFWAYNSNLSNNISTNCINCRHNIIIAIFRLFFSFYYSNTFCYPDTFYYSDIFCYSNIFCYFNIFRFLYILKYIATKYAKLLHQIILFPLQTTFFSIIVITIEQYAPVRSVRGGSFSVVESSYLQMCAVGFMTTLQVMWLVMWSVMWSVMWLPESMPQADLP